MCARDRARVCVCVLTASKCLLTHAYIACFEGKKYVLRGKKRPKNFRRRRPGKPRTPATPYSCQTPSPQDTIHLGLPGGTAGAMNIDVPGWSSAQACLQDIEPEISPPTLTLRISALSFKMRFLYFLSLRPLLPVM